VNRLKMMLIGLALLSASQGVAQVARDGGRGCKGYMKFS
jgi:hypothetical protein